MKRSPYIRACHSWAAVMDANSIPDDIKTFINELVCRSHDATARRGSGSCPLHKGPTDVPSVMTCSEWLVVIGSLLQIVGVAVVFVELAVIRSNEFGEPTPWSKLKTRWRRLRRRPQVGAADELGTTDHATAVMTPAAPSSDATDAERLAYVERYVEILRNDVNALYGEIGRQAEALIVEVRKREEAVRAEMDRRDQDRRDKLRPAMVRQALGGACLIIGLILATIGSVT